MRLKELGVNSAGFENYAGLCYSGLKEFIEAWGCYRRAFNLDPSNIVYKSNFGIISNRLGETDEGLKVFSIIKDKELNTLAPNGMLAFASLLAKGKMHNSQYYNATKFKLIGEKAVLLKEAAQWPREVKSILSGLAELE